MRIVFSVILSTLFFSCSPDFTFSKHAKIKSLGVKLSYNDALYPQLEQDYKNALHDFILRYNTERHSFKLREVDNMDSSALELNVKDVKLVTRGQQATALGLQAGSFVAIGVFAPIFLATAAVPYMIFTSFLPYNRTTIEAKLSSDIAYHVSKARYFRI